MNGMSPMLLLALLAFGLLIAQGALGALQYWRIQKKYREVKTRNPFVSVARLRRLGLMKMALLGFGDDGRLREGYLLSGFTVFAGFRPLKGAQGQTVAQLRQTFAGPQWAAVQQAVGYAAEKFEGTTTEPDSPPAETGAFCPPTTIL